MSRYLNRVTRQFDNFLMTLLFISNILIACTWGEIIFTLLYYSKCWITCRGFIEFMVFLCTRAIFCGDGIYVIAAEQMFTRHFHELHHQGRQKFIEGGGVEISKLTEMGLMPKPLPPSSEYAPVHHYFWKKFWRRLSLWLVEFSTWKMSNAIKSKQICHLKVQGVTKTFCPRIRQRNKKLFSKQSSIFQWVVRVNRSLFYQNWWRKLKSDSKFFFVQIFIYWLY